MNPTADPVQAVPNIQTDPSIILASPILPVPVVSGSGVHKEEGPVISFASSAETVPMISKELGEIGIKTPVQHDNPNLTVEHNQVGMTISPSAQPVPVKLSENPFTMTPAQAKFEQKGSIENSSSWLAKLWNKFFTPKPQVMKGGLS